MSRIALWTTLESTVQPAFAFFCVVYLYTKLGSEQYGYLAVSLALVNLGGVLQAGFGAAITKVVSASQQVSQEGAATVQAVFVLFMVSGAFLIGIAPAVAVPLGKLLFPSGALDATTIGLLVFIAVISVATQLLDSVCLGVLRGLLMFKHIALIELATKLTLSAALLEIAASAGDRAVVPVLAVFTAANVVALTARLIVVYRLTSYRLVGPLSLTTISTRLVEAFSFGRWFWLQSLSALAFSTLDRMLIGKFLGASAAGLYSALTQFASLVHYFPAQIQSYLFPITSNMASTSASTLPAHLRKSVLVNFVLTASVAVVALQIPSTLALLGLGGGLGETAGANYWALLTAYGLISLNTPFFYFLLGVGQAKMAATTHLLAGLLTLIAQAAAAQSGVLEAACIARNTFAVVVILNGLFLYRQGYLSAGETLRN